MFERNRTADELMVLAFSCVICLSILPFFLLRAFASDWLIATVDLAAVMATSGLAVYVFITGNVRHARWLLASLCSILVIASVGLKGAGQINWLYPALVAMFLLQNPALAMTLALATICVLALMVWPLLNFTEFNSFIFSALATTIFIFAFTEHTLKKQLDLQRLADLDSLTGIGNRRALEEKLLQLVGMKRQDQANDSFMILIDLDEFKQINEQFGHNVGDQVLKTFVSLVSRRLRGNDGFYRLGGEEFVVTTTTNKNIDMASALAETIRETVDQYIFIRQIHLTISLGIAECRANETGLEWLSRADVAMYKAKQAGRNLCCIAA